MRTILKGLGQAYLVVGAILANILWLSYAWRGTWGAPGGIGFAQHTGFAGAMVAIGTLGAILRLLFWPFSLAVFLLDPQHPGIMHWLATGLDGGVVQSH